MGDDPSRRAEELATLRLGIDLGLTLIDTAEMYGEGRAETLVGEAIEGQRDEVFIVTKVYPHHASRGAMQRACDNSLRGCGRRRSTCTCCTGRARCRSTRPCRRSRRCSATARSATGA
jgi:aldehyde reductase